MRPGTDPERLGRSLIVIGLVASTWTSVTVGGQMLGDVALYGGAALAYLAGPRPRLLPRARRPSLFFLAVSAWLLMVGSTIVASHSSSPTTDLRTGAYIVLALVGTPLAILSYIRERMDAVRVYGALLVSLAVTGAATALHRYAGWDPIGTQRVWDDAYPYSTDRAVGLTSHPNIVGFAAAAILPAVVYTWQDLRGLLGRLPLIACTSLGLVGLVLSGSRGAAFGTALGVTAVAMYEHRRQAVRAIFLSAILVGGILVVMPESTLRRRLLGSSDAVLSDRERRKNLEASLNDLESSFPRGIGLGMLTEIHVGFLALLVAGGALMAVGYAVWVWGTLRAAHRVAKPRVSDMRDIGLASLAAGIGTIGYLAVSPFIYHRYSIAGASVALALACVHTGRTRSDQSALRYEDVVEPQTRTVDREAAP